MIALRDSYTPNDFAKLIERETGSIELKRGAGGKPLQEALVALSNTAGDLILIGVTTHARSSDVG